MTLLHFVIPAKAGIQNETPGPRFRGDDAYFAFVGRIGNA